MCVCSCRCAELQKRSVYAYALYKIIDNIYVEKMEFRNQQNEENYKIFPKKFLNR